MRLHQFGRERRNASVRSDDDRGPRLNQLILVDRCAGEQVRNALKSPDRIQPWFGILAARRALRRSAFSWPLCFAPAQLNKRLVHRQMEAMGLRAGLRAGTDLHALGWSTRASRDYMAKMREGVKEALTARDAAFGDYRTGAKAG